MNSTRIISDRDVIPNRAAGYEMEGSILKNQKYVSPTFNSTADGALYFNVVDLEHWDRALSDASIISPDSLRRMWTPFVLNDGKPNDSGYGFAWFRRQINDHRVVEHSGAWQGFTTYIARYLDDKLTVVVLTNLDSDHAKPGNMAHVVAGLVNLALMPPLSTPITDARPEVAEIVRSVLTRLKSISEVSRSIAPDAKIKLSPEFADDIIASLPGEWSAASMVLTKRTEADGAVDSTFRIGQLGNWRAVHVVTNSAMRITDLAVLPDPDNR
jgi:hypothetical protein